MDEKWRDFMDSAQKMAAEMGALAEDMLQTAGEKAASLVTAGKLNARMAEQKAEKEKLLQKIGSMMYDSHCGKQVDPQPVLETLREVDQVSRRMEETANALRRLQNTPPICPDCGAQGLAGDLFCRQCGRRLSGA